MDTEKAKGRTEKNTHRGFDRRARPPADLTFDYKNPLLLKKFLNEFGKIVPSRISRLSTKQQRQLAKAVKRARHLALLPYCGAHDKVTERKDRP